MKIALVTQEYPPFAGGAGLYTSHLADELAQLGHNVTVIAPAYTENTCQWDKERRYILNRTRKRFNSKFSFVIQCWLTALQLIREKPAVVHSTEAGAHKILAAISLIMLFSSKIFITIHGTEVLNYLAPGRRSFKGWLVKFLIRRLFSKAQRLICVSNSTKELLLSHFQAGDAVVVYPGINLRNFHTPDEDKPAAFKRRLNLEGPVLLSVSRLAEGKGHDVVIKSLNKVIGTVPDLHYVIVGDGDQREQLEILVNKLALKRHVTFAGKVEMKELPLYYSMSDIFVMPSRRGKSESFGVVYVEAYYYRKPVIGTTHGGVSEVIVNGETGYTVDPCSTEETASAITKLLSDRTRARQMGEAGHRLALERFNTNVMAREIFDLYTDGQREK